MRKILRVNSNEFAMNKRVTLILCLLPILSIYKTVLPGINIGELAVFFCVIDVLFTQKVQVKLKRNTLYATITLIVGCVLISVIDYVIFNVTDPQIYARMIRVLCYLIVACFLGNTFSVIYAAKYSMAIAKLATFITILQVVIFKVSGWRQYFVVKPWIYSSETYNENYYYILSTDTQYRAGGIFLEPSHYCQYCLIALTLWLCVNRKVRTIKETLWMLFVLFGVISSTSFLGLVGCLVWIILYVYLNTEKRMSYRKLAYIIAGVVLLGIMIFYNIDILQYTMMRLFSQGDFRKSLVWKNRMGSYMEIFDGGIYSFILGYGYGNVIPSSWYSSVAYILRSVGAFGTAICALLIASLYNFKSKKSIVVFAVISYLAFVSECLTNTWCIFLICWMFSESPKWEMPISRGE